MLLTLLSSSLTYGARDTVNFDFGWRHHLVPNGRGPPTPPAPRNTTCGVGETGYNWGTGGSVHSKSTAGECCAACVADTDCLCWDWNPATNQCYVKTECGQKVKADRVTGKLSNAPPAPGPTPYPALPLVDPAEAAVGFNDASWSLIDTPHDMLIAQPFDERATEKMAYIFRGAGWYRKHFNLPTEWEGTSIWLYVEGSFHATQMWLNGAPIGFEDENEGIVHKQGYTSYWLRLDNATGIKFGTGAANSNVLATYIDASSGTGWWYEGGGLMRHSKLVSAPKLHIPPSAAWVWTTGQTSTSDGGGVTFNVEATMANEASSASGAYTLAATVTEAGSTVTVGTVSHVSSGIAGGATEIITLKITVASGIKLWSVQSPSLYEIKVSVTTSATGSATSTTKDEVTLTTGVRTVEFDADKGLLLNKANVKVRGFCDHSNFGGVGGALPDRLNLFRAQKLRSVGGNAWRMAHNPPSPSRLDFMDALGMLCMDENRDYGGEHGQGGMTTEFVPDELRDMVDLVKRDRSHPSVMVWSFCNEVGCNNESAAESFREVSKQYDPTRAVTQNHHGSNTSGFWLDVQGFSHKHATDFDDFHKDFPNKPMMATECCSCMSQRGVDEDVCPNPKDGGCENSPAACPPGKKDCPIFYNNNIGECTSSQVAYSDTRDFVAGTFIWSGFDYLGEARGWPQNTKCRGTVSDVAGFTKETAYWIRSWWLSNITSSDAGKPPVKIGNTPTLFIVETWNPPPSGGTTRSINVYTNLPKVKLTLNGKDVEGGDAIDVPYFGQAVFPNVKYAKGVLVAVGMDVSGKTVATTARSTPASPVKIVLSLDAPSVTTGTGSAVLLDGEDIALVRASLVDAKGDLATNSAANITFSVSVGPGTIWASHNGDPANTSPSLGPWTTAYHGLARAFVRTTADYASSARDRRLMRAIDAEGGQTTYVANPDDPNEVAPMSMTVKASSPGLADVTIEIPLSTDAAKDSPVAVARASVRY